MNVVAAANQLTAFYSAKLEISAMTQELQNALFDYYTPQMPYGTATAKTGDPYEFITDQLGADLERALELAENDMLAAASYFIGQLQTV